VLKLPLNRIYCLLKSLSNYTRITDIEYLKHYLHSYRVISQDLISFLVCFVIEIDSGKRNDIYIVDINIFNVIISKKAHNQYLRVNYFINGSLDRSITLSKKYEEYISLLIRDLCMLDRLIEIVVGCSDYYFSDYNTYEEIDTFEGIETLENISTTLINQIITALKTNINGYPLKFKHEVDLLKPQITALP
jgi:hypothetical protein